MRDMTGAALLRRNTIHNMLGEAMPLLAALAAVPVLLDRLEGERFGVLMLVLGILAASGLLDLGLGRAVTHLAARRLGSGRAGEVRSVVRASTAAMLCVGSAAGLALGVATPWLAVELVEAAHVDETRLCLWLLALALPIVLPTTVFRGVLEAFQRFPLINTVRIPAGFLAFAAPMGVALLGGGLVAVVLTLLIVRIAALLGYVILAAAVIPRPQPGAEALASPWGELWRFGGWVTVSNAVAPVILYTDRFIISARLSATAVGWYATPFEVLARLWIVPGALVGVLLPAFSFDTGAGGERLGRLYGYGLAIVFWAMLPLTLAAAAWAHPGLSLWLGEDFADHSSRAAQWLAAGVFLNSLGQLPLTLIQGAGRPDLSALIHAAQVPFYIGGLWWGVAAFGIEGAGVVWLVRSAVDTMLLLIVADRLTEPKYCYSVRLSTGAGVSLLLFVAVSWLSPAAATVVVGVAAAGTIGVAARYRRVLMGRGT